MKRLPIYFRRGGERLTPCTRWWMVTMIEPMRPEALSDRTGPGVVDGNDDRANETFTLEFGLEISHPMLKRC